jgi:hypothetical protein
MHERKMKNLIEIRKSKKAQASLEFILVFSILTIFVATFLVTIFYNMSQGRIKNEREGVENMANFIQQELILSSKVEDGYNRTFLLPRQIGGKDYSVSMSDYSLVVNTSITASFRGIPLLYNSSALFNIPGNNSIIKNQTGIFVNP